MNRWAGMLVISAFAVTLVASSASAQESPKSFPDVPQTHWASDAVQQLAKQNVLKGYPDGKYDGKRAVTRYETALGLQRLLDYSRKQIDEQVGRGERGLTPPGRRGPQGPAGLPGRTGPQGARGPAGDSGAGFNELPELFREQGRLRQDFDATRDTFAGLRDQIRQVRANLKAIGVESNGLANDVSRTEKRARRAPFSPPRAPLGQ